MKRFRVEIMLSYTVEVEDDGKAYEHGEQKCESLEAAWDLAIDAAAVWEVKELTHA